MGRAATALVFATAFAGLALAAARLVAPTDKPSGYIAGTAIVTSVDQADGSSLRLLTVERPGGGRALIVGNDAQMSRAQLRSGKKVRITGRWLKHPGRGGGGAGADGAPGAPVQTNDTACEHTSECLWAEDIAEEGGGKASAAAIVRPASSGGKLMFTYNALVSSSLNTLFIPLAALANVNDANSPPCPGMQLPPLSRLQVQQKVFPEFSGGTVSVGALFNRCSYQKTRLSAATSNVTHIIRLPCRGYGQNGTPWSFSSCTVSDYNGWADAANARLRAQGISVDSYRYRVYLIPPGVCSWVGLAYVGCDGSFECRTWMAGGVWGTPMAIAHEMGHNLGQDHSVTASGGAYTDNSCIMGGCCFDRCFSTPRAWQMGWITLLHLDSSNLPVGGPGVVLSMYSQSVAASPAGVRINVASWLSGTPAVFLGYRTADNFDAPLAGFNMTDKVHIYQSDIDGGAGPAATTWLGMLAVNESFTVPGTGVTVRRLPASTPPGGTPIAMVAVTRSA